MSVRDDVRAALANATEPLTVDELAKKVFGRIGARERNAVHLALHRLSADGQIKKRAATYELIK